jgi:hypothetical protein
LDAGLAAVFLPAAPDAGAVVDGTRRRESKLPAAPEGATGSVEDQRIEAACGAAFGVLDRVRRD